MKKFFKVFFYSVGFSSLNLVMQIVAGIFVTIAYLVLFKAPQLLSGPDAIQSLNMEEILNDILLPILLTAALLTFGAAWLAHVIFKRRFLERLSFEKTSFLFIGICLLAGLAMQLPISFLISLVESTGVAPDIFKEYTELIDPLMSGQGLFLQILTIGIVVPILEEIIFRGLVFNQFRKNLPTAIALILQALLFGLAHMNIVQGSYAFVAGVLMGLTLLWSGSLLLPVFMHVGMNVAGVLLSTFGEALSDKAYTLLIIASFVIIAVCMLLINRLTKKETESKLQSVS